MSAVKMRVKRQVRIAALQFYRPRFSGGGGDPGSKVRRSMNVRFRWIAAALAAAAFSLLQFARSSGAQAPAARPPVWRSDYEPAVVEAAASGRPMLIGFRCER